MSTRWCGHATAPSWPRPLDHTARIWNAATGKLSRTLTGHTDGVNDVAWSPDGTQLATASADHTARTWNV
jgi:WD40 repeat protein